LVDELIIHTDGGSRGNPGPGAAAYVLTDNKKQQLEAGGFYLGRTTNNIAEYAALIKALEAAKQKGAKKITVFSDSELLVRQINGEYRVKSGNLKHLYTRAIELLGYFADYRLIYIPRADNAAADKLVNQAIDKKSDIDRTTMKDSTEDTGFLFGNFSQNGAPQKPVRLGVLISGGGTTLINILEKINAGQLNAKILLVISSLSKAAGVEKARKAGLNVKIIRRKDFDNIDDFSARLEEELISADVDLVIQAGWLCLWKIPARYENRVMNIHPALLPAFGGKGMWGHYVHEAVLKKGVKVSGCTVHFCTNEYDVGPIIIQRTCEVKDDDSPQTLAERVFRQECIAYPEAIRLFAAGRLDVENGRVKIKA